MVQTDNYISAKSEAKAELHAMQYVVPPDFDYFFCSELHGIFQGFFCVFSET